LPEAQRQLHPEHADFRVRGKVFAYYLVDHHGDGRVAICCRTALGEHTDLVAREPARFYLPAHIGKRGWFGLRLDQGRVNWKEVAGFVTGSYRLAAPARLLRLLDGP
jgi:predicted DNA-binding protein (MmcQ/YjbR family)